jgi:hypothetical protein
MKKGIVPRSGIDTDARWGYSHTKGWIWIQSTSNMYNRRSCGTPNSRCNITNVPDNKMYVPLTSSSSSSSFSVFSLPSLRYIVADHGYDAKKLYGYSKELGIDLVCHVERYASTSKKRLEIVCFYQSVLGQAIYSKRISVEPLIEHIKTVFRIDQLPVRGFQAISAIVLLSVLLYHLMIYYNCKKNTSNPKSIKCILGTW